MRRTGSSSMNSVSRRNASTAQLISPHSLPCFDRILGRNSGCLVHAPPIRSSAVPVQTSVARSDAPSELPASSTPMARRVVWSAILYVCQPRVQPAGASPTTRQVLACMPSLGRGLVFNEIERTLHLVLPTGTSISIMASFTRWYPSVPRCIRKETQHAAEGLGEDAPHHRAP